MVSSGIRETIAAAIRKEGETNQLRLRLEQQLPQLSDKLVLPDTAPVPALMTFIVDYVESVPDCLQLVTTVSKQQGFYDYAAPFLHMAEDYFLQPPDELPVDEGLEALLDEAFLAHRLLEEINDHHIRQIQRPLLPVDMTEANIIVHHLLGDEFASHLEQLVQFTASQLLHREYVWDEVRAIYGVATPVITSENLSDSPQQIRLRLAS